MFSARALNLREARMQLPHFLANCQCGRRRRQKRCWDVYYAFAAHIEARYQEPRTRASVRDLMWAMHLWGALSSPHMTMYFDRDPSWPGDLVYQYTAEWLDNSFEEYSELDTDGIDIFGASPALRRLYARETNPRKYLRARKLVGRVRDRYLRGGKTNPDEWAIEALEAIWPFVNREYVAFLRNATFFPPQTFFRGVVVFGGSKKPFSRRRHRIGSVFMTINRPTSMSICENTALRYSGSGARDGALGGERVLLRIFIESNALLLPLLNMDNQLLDQEVILLSPGVLKLQSRLKSEPGGLWIANVTFVPTGKFPRELPRPR